MPTPIILGGARTASYKRVYTKRKWDDNWTFQPRIKPKQLSRYLSPQIGEADFTVFYGNIQPVGMPFGFYSAFDLNGYYVKVTSQKLDGLQPAGTPEEGIDWVGIIVNTETRPQSNTEPLGIQRIKAFELAWLLLRTKIRQARVQDDRGLSIYTIDHAPPFNMVNPFVPKKEQSLNVGTKRLFGNANADQTAFSNTREWTGLGACKYLLSEFAPKPIPWAFDGQHDSLRQWIDIWVQEGLSIKEIFDAIINQQLGYCWYIDTDGQDYCDVRVSTMFGSDFVQGDVTIPKNDRQVSYSIPTRVPDRHIWGAPTFTHAAEDRYDRIVVQGNCVKVVGTFSIADGTLIAGWTDAHENAYRNEPGTPQVADAARSKHIYDRVFTHFVVPRYGANPWDGRLGNGLGGPRRSAVPSQLAADEGDVFFTAIPGQVFKGTLSFEPILPFLEGKYYGRAAGDALFDTNGPDDDPEYRTALVAFQDPIDGLYMEAPYMTLKQPYYPGASISLLTKEPGVKVQCSPQHIVADSSPSLEVPIARRGQPFPNTMHDNMIYYGTIIFTGFFVTDVRPKIVIEAGAGVASERKEELVVTVKSAEFWYAMRNCVVDISAAGLPVTIHATHAEPNALRNDKAKLEQVAAMLSEWFSVERAAIRLPVNDYGYGLPIAPELGVYIKEVKGLFLDKGVNSVTRGLMFDCERDTMLIETSFVDLDARLKLVETVTQLSRLEIEFGKNAR